MLLHKYLIWYGVLYHGYTPNVFQSYKVKIVLVKNCVLVFYILETRYNVHAVQHTEVVKKNFGSLLNNLR